MMPVSMIGRMISIKWDGKHGGKSDEQSFMATEVNFVTKTEEALPNAL